LRPRRFRRQIEGARDSTAIYYPKSMHQQTAYRDFADREGGLPVCESLSRDGHTAADACYT